MLVFISCKDSSDPDTGDGQEQLNIETATVNFEYNTDKKFVKVTTNLTDITCLSTVTWCKAEYIDGTIEIAVERNETPSDRATIITVQAGAIKKRITVKQSAKRFATGEIKEDIKFTPSSATANASQSGQGIDKSYDGNKSTIYHSPWDGTGFPIILTYNFTNVPAMDYIVYYPRPEGSNGNFKEFELWIATEANPALTKYNDYDFKGSSSPTVITFDTPLEKPMQIEFRVKNGVGDNNKATGFVSCSEMEFCRHNPDNFDYLTIFKDKACSALKDGITEADINKIGNEFFKDLALNMFKGTYDSEFRIQTYKPYTDPDIFAQTSKTSPYSLRDNPTGIYVNTGDELIVLANELNGQNICLFVQNSAGDNAFGGITYALAAGINKIKIQNTGLIYVMYHTPTAQEPPVKIHFATGNVNGYFDKTKHSKEDWTKLLSKATFKLFDVVGRYAHLTFDTESFRTYTTDGLKLINRYDDLVYKEWDFMGYFKHNRVPGNRVYFLVVYTDAFMFATSYYTGYQVGTLNSICDESKFATTACWGPAHEVGHCNQTRPGLKWQGMTEVTNNIHSLYVETEWGNESRLIYDGFYNTAFTKLLKKGIPHNSYDGGTSGDTPFIKLVPFWQLKLYMHDVLGKNDFYKDVYEKVRLQNDAAIDIKTLTEGYYQLEFTKICCEVANLNLTDFFEAWGFYKPIDIEIDDYKKTRFTITQAQIDQVKSEIAAKNYPQPKHNNIYDIRDDNLNNFR